MNKYNIIQSMTFFLLLVVFPINQVVNATVIDPNISISWGTTFDDGFSLGSTSGDITNTEGGVTTGTTTFTGSTVTTGDNPLNGTAANTGDGFRIAGLGNTAIINDEFKVGIDNFVDIINNSTSSTFELVLKLVHSNLVDSSGDDAFADSEFTVDINGSEVFFSDLISDTVNGNKIGGNKNGLFGGVELESGTELFIITLAPLESVLLDFKWILRGGNFADGGNAAFNSSFDLSIESVTDPSAVPIPGSLVLLGTGLFSLLGITRKRKTIVA